MKYIVRKLFSPLMLGILIIVFADKFFANNLSGWDYLLKCVIMAVGAIFIYHQGQLDSKPFKITNSNP